MGFSGNKPQGKTVPNSYLVVLNPKLSEEEVTTHINSIKSGEGQGHAELPNNSFQTFAFPKKDDVGAARSAATAFPSFRGYIGTFSPSTAEKIKESSQVDYVEQNQYYQVQNRVVQPDPPSWGLSRVSHRGPYTTGNHDYVYDDDESGKGVTAYVVDTGVKNDHQDFGGRVRWGMTVDTRADTYGHGTHVAGTIAGTKHGVAKEASIVAVKVFPDNSGTTETSTIIQGLEWAAGDALLNGNTDKCVVNLSLGGPRSQAMNDMIQAIVQVGMKVVVAAGNDSQDALHVSPASSRHAITVGAIDKSDAITWWSNWGRGETPDQTGFL
jgi:subtilisin family serine protease